MANFFISAAMSAKVNKETWEINSDDMQYLYQWTNILEEGWHRLWHSLQTNHKNIIDLAFKKSFDAKQWYTWWMAEIYRLIDEWRNSEKLYMLAIYEKQENWLLIPSPWMGFELEHFSIPTQNTDIITVYPSDIQQDMDNDKNKKTRRVLDNSKEASIYTHKYRWNINSPEVYHDILQTLKWELSF